MRLIDNYDALALIARADAVRTLSYYAGKPPEEIYQNLLAALEATDLADRLDDLTMFLDIPDEDVFPWPPASLDRWDFFIGVVESATAESDFGMDVLWPVAVTAGYMPWMELGPSLARQMVALLVRLAVPSRQAQLILNEMKSADGATRAAGSKRIRDYVQKNGVPRKD